MTPPSSFRRYRRDPLRFCICHAELQYRHHRASMLSMGLFIRSRLQVFPNFPIPSSFMHTFVLLIIAVSESLLCPRALVALCFVLCVCLFVSFAPRPSLGLLCLCRRRWSLSNCYWNTYYTYQSVSLHIALYQYSTLSSRARRYFFTIQHFPLE